MSDALVHRGPDGQGLHTTNNIALAHQRLAIIDLSSGDQPMFNEDRSVAIVFNGEIYNYLELREELKSFGHRFITQSDTEVLIRAYEEWGTELHTKLNGMWAFAIWDERKNQLLVSRDRIGEKPLYYAQHDGTFLFASELKSILAYGFPREANLEVLEIYLALGYVPAPFSFVKNIHKLPPGHYAIVKDGRIRMQQYWNLPALDEENMLTSRKEVFEQFQSLFYDSIRLRMRSDVSYGAFLSGGLDSSSVVAVMSEIGGQPVETFTIGFDEKDFDERALAREVASQFKTKHHEYTVTPDSFDESLERTLHHFDEPFGDSSAIPTGYVSKYASERVKMVLTGDGGDEALSGYNAYQSEKFATQYQRLPRVLRGIPIRCLGLASMLGGRAHKQKLARVGKVLRTSNLDFNERLLAKAAWAEVDLVRHLLRPLSGRVIRVDEYLNDFMNGCAYRDNFYRMMYYHIKLTLPEDMLTKVDRMSMAYSLEARVPFLDHRLIEFMAHAHKDIKMRGYERKSVLRCTVGRSLPRSILKAPKKGFVVPMREWFKDRSLTASLPNYLAQTPLDMNRDLVDEIAAKNAAGLADYGNFIWMLFLLGKWFQT
jgi:asparagine synthase (glutamine-hydrolysing)